MVRFLYSLIFSSSCDGFSNILFVFSLVHVSNLVLYDWCELVCLVLPVSLKSNLNSSTSFIGHLAEHRSITLKFVIILELDGPDSIFYFPVTVTPIRK
jgi:hypothetical protein